MDRTIKETNLSNKKKLWLGYDAIFFDSTSASCEQKFLRANRIYFRDKTQAVFGIFLKKILRITIFSPSKALRRPLNLE